MVQKYNFQILVLHNSKEDDCKLFIICFKQIIQIIPRKKLVLIKSFWARNASSPTHTAGFAACVRETLLEREQNHWKLGIHLNFWNQLWKTWNSHGAESGHWKIPSQISLDPRITQISGLWNVWKKRRHQAIVGYRPWRNAYLGMSLSVSIYFQPNSFPVPY